jgi:hypothetical protein
MRRLPQATPARWDPRFVTPTSSVKEASPCFAGSWRRRRLRDEGLGKQARKKLLEARRQRMWVEGVMPRDVPEATACPHLIGGL